MRPITYRKIQEIVTRIQSEILSEFSPGDRLPSEREIADRLQETHNRVHRALKFLVEEGTIHSTGGRCGMYFTPKLSSTSKHTKQPITLRFSLPLTDNLVQYQQWKRICELFHMIEPTVEIEMTSNDMDRDVEADFYLTWPPVLNVQRYKELDLSTLDAIPKMVPGLLQTGVQYGKQYALPIFHSPGAYWAHRNMLRKCSLAPADFSDPMDFINWGEKLEEAGLCVSGYSFLGFVYHSVQWGVGLHREGDYILMDRDRLWKFFKELYKKSYRNFSIQSRNNYDMFHRGQQGLLAGYLNALPLEETRFQVLGQPLRKDGYSCQAVFLMTMGRNTKYESVVYDFFRFILTDHIQEMFLLPYVKFSAIESVYRKQYEWLRNYTGFMIPEFDFRGVFPQIDMDFFAHIGRYLYLESAEVLLGYKSMEKVVEKFSRICVPEHREIWMKTASNDQLNTFSEFIERVKNGNLG